MNNVFKQKSCQILCDSAQYLNDCRKEGNKIEVENGKYSLSTNSALRNIFKNRKFWSVDLGLSWDDLGTTEIQAGCEPVAILFSFNQMWLVFFWWRPLFLQISVCIIIAINQITKRPKSLNLLLSKWNILPNRQTDLAVHWHEKEDFLSFFQQQKEDL